MLATGRDNSDPLFLQLKQAEASVLERFVGRSRYRNHGRRVVEGQRLTQAASDIMLGWYKVLAFDGKVHDFYVRQLWDGKASVDVATMPVSLFGAYARDVRLDARARPRPDRRPHRARGVPRARATSSTTRSPTSRSRYADQNERDFEAMQAAHASGRIQAEMDV